MPITPSALTPENLELIDWAVKNLYHFSFKLTNSNAAQGGIRLDPRVAALDLPYVSVRTAMADGLEIPLDYIGDGQASRPPFGRLRTALGEHIDSPEPKRGETPSEAATRIAAIHEEQQAADMFYAEYAQRTQQAAADLCSDVGMRMRQLILPKAGGYVTVSPVGSTGLGIVIRTIIRKREEANERNYPKVREFGVGGSVSANVGGRIWAMTKPLVFAAIPEENQDIRTSYGVLYNGFKYRIPRTLVQNYAKWLSDQRAKNQGRLRLSVFIRAQEQHLLQEIVGSVRRQAAYVAGVLEKQGELLEEYRGTIDDLSRGFLFPGRKPDGWVKTAATGLNRALQRYSLGSNHDGIHMRIPFLEEDVSRVQQHLERILK